VTEEARLGPSSYVILGILAAAGPQTPYSLKQAVGRTIGYYWPFPHAQIYAETARLAGLGLAVEDREAGGLRRRTYAITAVGREALAAWLAAPTPDPAQFRDLGLLKLAFGSLASPEARRTLRDGQVAAHEERLATYERYATLPLDRYLRGTLELGLRYERAALGFWRTLDLEDDAPVGPRGAPTAREGPPPPPRSTSG
jgi:DNA-binding PadR family transcriptional regulator